MSTDKLYIEVAPLASILQIDIKTQLRLWPGKYALPVQNAVKTNDKTRQWWGGMDGGFVLYPIWKVTLQDKDQALCLRDGDRSVSFECFRRGEGEFDNGPGGPYPLHR